MPEQDTKTTALPPAQAEEMDRLITRGERHQKALGLSDTQFVSRYQRHLSSTRTWRDRLCKRDFREMDAAKWLGKLRALALEMDGGTPPEEFFDTLPIYQEMDSYYTLLQGRTTDRRCAVALGPTGVAKSYSAKAICRREGPKLTAYVRANENWKDSKAQIARGLARAVGSQEAVGGAVCFEMLMEHLKANPVTVFVDEAHEGGVLLFKLVKTLIDETKAKFFLLCYPTKWHRLVRASDDAHAEAQQLLGRTLKPVIDGWEDGVHADDVTAFLAGAFPAMSTDDTTTATERVLSAVRGNGNLRLLADAVEAARMRTADTGAEVSVADLVASVDALCPARRGGFDKGGAR